MRINFFHTAATSTRLQDEGKLSVPLDFYRNCRSLLSLPFPQPQISVFWLKGQLTALNKYFFFLILLSIRVCLKGRLLMTCSILASFCILQSKLQRNNKQYSGSSYQFDIVAKRQSLVLSSDICGADTQQNLTQEKKQLLSEKLNHEE